MQMWKGLGSVEGVGECGRGRGVRKGSGGVEGVGKTKAANVNLKIEEKVDTPEFMKVVPISFSFRKFFKFCLQYSFLPFWGLPAVWASLSCIRLSWAGWPPELSSHFARSFSKYLWCASSRPPSCCCPENAPLAASFGCRFRRLRAHSTDEADESKRC